MKAYYLPKCLVCSHDFQSFERQVVTGAQRCEVTCPRSYSQQETEPGFGPVSLGFPYSSVDKESACSAGDPGSIPGLGRSPGEGNGNPFQYSCLENPMDGGAWWATVHGVAKSQTRLSYFFFLSFFIFLAALNNKNLFSTTFNAISEIQNEH